jgi:tRNA threonylcarbamoyladenosine biosynthesis protein TsaB
LSDLLDFYNNRLVVVLAVDTTSERGSICFGRDGEILGEIRLASSVQHSERLFRSIEFLLDYLPFTLDRVDLFAAARGPGSFTGLRVGLAAIEGFAAAHGQPSAGVSNLEALAWKAGIEDHLVSPVIDARRGEVYAALYRRTSAGLLEQRAPGAFKPEAWFESLPNERIYFCGDGAGRYVEFINRPAWEYYKMDLYLAATVAEMAAMGKCGPLQPLYVRRTDAEVAREGRQGTVPV